MAAAIIGEVAITLLATAAPTSAQADRLTKEVITWDHTADMAAINNSNRGRGSSHDGIARGQGREGIRRAVTQDARGMILKPSLIRAAKHTFNKRIRRAARLALGTRLGETAT
jgi:hypothetical protein